MYDFHTDKKNNFDIQYRNAKESIIPFISPHIHLDENVRVLEIGCAEAGVLKSFTELGCRCVGVELSPSRVEFASGFMQEELEKGQIRFISKDIYDVDVQSEIGHGFDLIIMKDVIEHIHDQRRFLGRLQDFLNPGGLIFFGFPPFMMPFGGHQQICENRVAARLPWYHLFPVFLYRRMLKLFNETDDKIDSLLEIKETGISIERFEKIVKLHTYTILERMFYLVAPIYKYKFNMRPRKQFSMISALPYLRDYVTMAAYYIIQLK